VAVEVTFDFEGDRSGAPVKRRAGAVYTVAHGKIIRAEHFMDRAEAFAAAGIE
jgi:ketosteroid isomerase-like protein